MFHQFADDVQVFGLAPRIADYDHFWKAFCKTVQLSDEFGMSGMLIFQGNDVYIEPWAAAQYLLAETRRLCPFVAVNPIYMHPFTAAKMIASLTLLYNRKIYLNLITGTATSYLESMDDHLTHDDRYERLVEYTQLVMSLLVDSSRTFEGRFYKTKSLYLRHTIPAGLLPSSFLAGQSEAARRTAATLSATSMHMLPPRLAGGLDGVRGVNLGIVTRPTEAEAWRVARSLFPEDRTGQRMLTFSMNNTDSEWKKRLALATEREAEADAGYWMGPFRNFQADNPYFVGDHDHVAALIARCVQAGVKAFILDLPPAEEEFANVRIAFSKAEEILQRSPSTLAASAAN
jgi:alkanesulfonate monooxygenase